MANTTKDLNRTLKKGDLMSIAVGQIIGNLFRGAAVDIYGFYNSCYGRYIFTGGNFCR